MATLVSMATIMATIHEKIQMTSYETTEPIIINFISSIYMMVIQDLEKTGPGDDSKFKIAVMPILW